MALNNLNPRSQWSSSLSYLIVMIGVVVGLANVIQFPYLVSQYGGLFVLFYIIFELIISLPLLFVELSIGRRGKQNPVGAIDILCLESGASRRWRYLGWLCFIVSFFTLSYYTVQAAFPLSYFLGSLNIISLYGPDTPVTVALHGMSNFLPIEICFLFFLFATMLVIARGINRGLEKISWICVPMFLFILVILAVYMAFTGNFANSLKMLFTSHPGHSIFMVMIAAMGYAFFTLNVGMGCMIVYGSYLPYAASFRQSTIIIAIVDAVSSLLAYFIIFPLMLNSPSFVDHLTNHNVIYLFSGVKNGFIIAALFFFAAVIAGWTSTIAMAETAAITMIERFGITRLRATIILFIGSALLGTFAALTHTSWMNVMITDSLPLIGILRDFTGTILVPISALGIAIFAGWVVKKNIFKSELRFSPFIWQCWYFLVKYVAPLLILFLLLSIIFI